jgi:hypothetical protein
MASQPDPAPEPETDDLALETDAAALAAAEALLGRLEAGRAPSAPTDDLVQALEGRVTAVVFDVGPSGAADWPEAAVVDAVGPTCTGLAVADAPGADAAGRALVAALRRLPVEARAGVAVGPGRISARGVLGEAPSLAFATFGRHATPGVYLHAGARALAGAPLAMAGEDLRLPRTAPPSGTPRRVWPWLAAGLLAAGLTFALLPQMLRPAPPHGALALFGERAPANAARGDDPAPGAPLTLAEGDAVRILVTAEVGTFVTLLAFDSHDRLELPDPQRLTNQARTELQERWALDAATGTEQVLAVVSRAPWKEPVELLSRLNDRPGLTRAERLEAFEKALETALPGGFRLLRGAEIRHVPR